MPRAGAGLVEESDRALFEHAGADAAEHVVAGLPFEHDRCRCRSVQQLPEQEPAGPGADDSHSRSHSLKHSPLMPFPFGHRLFHLLRRPARGKTTHLPDVPGRAAPRLRPAAILSNLKQFFITG